jgi:hypothetical protein
LTKSYKELQSLETKLDWNFSRKAIELSEKSTESTTIDSGERLDRVMRIHVEIKIENQEWQLEKQEIIDQTSSSSLTPKVSIRLSGKVLDDDENLVPFTSHYQRITIESSLLTTGPLIWNRSSSSSLPSSLNFSIPLSIPSSTSTSTSSSSSLGLKITLQPFSYPLSTKNQLFTLLPPELSQLLNVSECTRSEALHNLWLYVRSNNLIIETGGGIKTQEDQGQEGGLGKKWFGGMEKIAWHHLGEWVNRWLSPTVPRVIEIKPVQLTSSNSSSHQAFDLPLSIFSSSSSSGSSPSRSSSSKTASILSTLSNSITPSSESTSTTTNQTQSNNPLVQALESLNQQISNSSLKIQTHRLNLFSLLNFLENPKEFLLKGLLENQSSDLETLLSLNGGGSGGNGVVVGNGWKESLRGSKYFNTRSGEQTGGEGEEWVKEAVGIWLAREREGELRKYLTQQQQQNRNQTQNQNNGSQSNGITIRLGGGGGSAAASGGQQQQQQMGYGRR